MSQVRADICTGIFRSMVNLSAFEQMMARNQQRAKATGPSEPDGDAQSGTGGGRTPDGKPIKLPKIKRRPPPPVLNAPGRNETVRIRRGTEELEMKWKKAEPLVKGEGWELLPKK
jgi:preprotein translocase subunit SecA